MSLLIELTPHELRVLMTYARVGDTLDTARALGLKHQTVKNELLVIRRKLGVKSTIAAFYRVSAHMKLDDLLGGEAA